MNLLAAASFTDGANGIGARLGVGNSQAYGGAAVGYTSYSNSNMSATSFGVVSEP
jgi:hypothetical protein